MLQRVVVTGLGVVSPNGVGISDFEKAIKAGVSGIKFIPQLDAMNFSCCVGGIPPVTHEMTLQYLTELQLKNFNSSGIIYGCMAGVDAWKDAGLDISEDVVDWDSGCVFGTGISGVEKMRESAYLLDEGKVKRLGSNAVSQTMTSGVSAYLGGILGLGNQVTTNSSACTTGTEAILMAFERIQNGKAKRMLAGSCSDHGPYIWGGFDAMKVMTFRHNDSPEQASRPLSATASGFVPGSGAGALMLESLESAQERGATIYAEVLGGSVNSGGQRNGGSMTAPNALAIKRCIQDAIFNAGINAEEIDLINGHLTATMKDPDEVREWAEALGREPSNFPYIHSLKSMIGHCIGAAGSIESVAAVLGLKGDYIFPKINCEDLQPEIALIVPREKIPSKLIENAGLKVVAKAGFGFGDVNCCVIFKKYENG
ncbi:MAG TPA: beta-ketoacyl-[acyl-carrier-protein] synthase family protein [Saprospiraceae bacterium]|nr:beta-ketoacyl-[acyl-carrier-protein] synthase family protein [Saprospiraceae bacterium]